MKCELCEETRGIQKCHILSRKLDSSLKGYVLDGLPYLERNILLLCPNHHWAFDHNLLNDTELGVIAPKILYMLKAFDKIFAIFSAELTDDQRSFYLGYRAKDILRNKTILTKFSGEVKRGTNELTPR